VVNVTVTVQSVKNFSSGPSSKVLQDPLMVE